MILLIMDDAVDEAQAVHILTKYHFANSVVRIRRTREALNYFMEASSEKYPQENLPELIVMSMGVTGADKIGLAIESRKNGLEAVPLIIVTDSGDAEHEIRRFGLVRTYIIGKPIGFFKLLEAIQKLGMYWNILRAPPG
jgi:DNA-binding response OmpR family regulator